MTIYILENEAHMHDGGSVMGVFESKEAAESAQDRIDNAQGVPDFATIIKATLGRLIYGPSGRTAGAESWTKFRHAPEKGWRKSTEKGFE